ncbi:PREDICTED: uncharacterized protein LOC109586971 [Amphimedon queenslandica]|uniref:NACHT domain-containing protein n=1 Tax=Amphimedon queenslandica TaxID=400682 RepID=A0A1X7VR35_AMPQE|nr:PREDICTED: uncharacterized protein LOC109586971 [Amphimedon queenslandica]|eukprot:XP_019858744.1 PREDICTED: uncharacterized protein LOC109586971 [Amphimedon queenslandica]
MIDLCQWRASIGSWNCCQAATGRRSHYDSDQESLPTRDCTSGRNKAPVFQASAVDLISFIIFFILLFCASRLTPTGHCTSFQLLVGDDILKWLQLCVGASVIGSFNLFTVSFNLYFYFLLILLSGDVELNPGPVTDKPLKPDDAPSLLRSASAELTGMIASTLYKVTDLLYAQGLISLDTKEDIYEGKDNNSKKAGRLLITLQKLLEASSNQKQYLINVCYILLSQNLVPLKEITVPILKELGKLISDDQELKVTIILPPDDVQEYAEILRHRYNLQPIIAEDWPPRVGKDFFGRLTLIEGQNMIKRAEQQIHWHMLRGEVDKIPYLSGNREIKIEDLLKTKNFTLLKKNKDVDVDLYSSQNIVIDGPPGIGKTTLCRKLLNMWSNGVLGCLFDLVLYCPLRNSKVAKAEKLEELFRYVYDCPTILNIVDWVSKKHGKGLLIIFDGWDELSLQHRESSLVANIICNNQLAKCSVIVTSRSYATASLLKTLKYVSKHVQIIGLSTKELSTVIIKTIQEDSDLAEKLINENANNEFFKTTQYNKDSELAVKLINELKVRGDVQSLCYIPLVCSMVILVYCKAGGHLPTTLTQLYENFILQTIQRHIERKHGTDPETLVSLETLPSKLDKALKELSYLAYTTLADTKMTFSLQQLDLSVAEAAKEDYLGLLTKFEEFGEKKYQFIHLSIQEFLAAWWISKHDNTETIFNDYFDNEHFKMCLRFVAGLTHLENESYQQYFEKKKQLQCESSPLGDFETSWFNGFIQHARGFDFEELQVLLLQFLYESQNTTLCKLFTNSIEGQSLCLNRKAGISNSVITKLSLFEWLCFSYLINNADWDRLDLHKLDEQSLSVLTAGLSNTSLVSQCQKLKVMPKNISDSNLLLNFFAKALLHNIQDIIVLFERNTCDLVPTLIQLVTLPQLKVLLFGGEICTDLDETTYIRKCSELQQCIKTNSKLQTIVIFCYDLSTHKLLEPFVAGVINGITQNKMITSFTLKLLSSYSDHHALTDGVIENLLRNNNTLQDLSITIPNCYIPLPVNKMNVMSTLTSLEIESGSILMNLLLPCIKGLECLILPLPYPPRLIFDSHPNLQQLNIQLDTAKSINDLFTILQTNTKLEALLVKLEIGSIFTICSIGRCNYSYYKKKCMSASSYISIITTGIKRKNCLQKFSIPVFLPITNEKLKSFLNVISKKYSFRELEVHFKLDQTCYYFLNDEKKIMKTFFYKQILPDIFHMLQSHPTITKMSIVCEYLEESSDTNTTAIEELFHRTRFPSLKQLEIKRTGSQCMIKTFTKNVVEYLYWGLYRYPITREIKMYIH